MVHVLNAIARVLGAGIVYKQNCKVAVESYKLPLDTIHIFHYRPGGVDDRLLASLVQDVWDKFCSQRTLDVDQAMWMLQHQQWTERLKCGCCSISNGLRDSKISVSPAFIPLFPSLSMHACAARVTLCVCLTHIFPDTVYTLKGRYIPTVLLCIFHHVYVLTYI